jgi:hypothetical protein
MSTSVSKTLSNGNSTGVGGSGGGGGGVASATSIRTDSIDSIGNTLSIAGNIGTQNLNMATANGIQTVNMATGTGAKVINIGVAGDTLNLQGNVVTVQSTDLQVTDPTISVNKGAGAATGASCGIDVLENDIATGYAHISGDRTSWQLKAPAGPIVTLDQSLATTDAPTFASVTTPSLTSTSDLLTIATTDTYPIRIKTNDMVAATIDTNGAMTLFRGGLTISGGKALSLIDSAGSTSSSFSHPAGGQGFNYNLPTANALPGYQQVLVTDGYNSPATLSWLPTRDLSKLTDYTATSTDGTITTDVVTTDNMTQGLQKVDVRTMNNTETLNTATAANTPNTIVKRAGDGGVNLSYVNASVNYLKGGTKILDRPATGQRPSAAGHCNQKCARGPKTTRSAISLPVFIPRTCKQSHK